MYRPVDVDERLIHLLTYSPLTTSVVGFGLEWKDRIMLESRLTTPLRSRGHNVLSDLLKSTGESGYTNPFYPHSISLPGPPETLGQTEFGRH